MTLVTQLWLPIACRIKFSIFRLSMEGLLLSKFLALFAYTTLSLLSVNLNDLWFHTLIDLSRPRALEMAFSQSLQVLILPGL